MENNLKYMCICITESPCYAPKTFCQLYFNKIYILRAHTHTHTHISSSWALDPGGGGPRKQDRAPSSSTVPGARPLGLGDVCSFCQEVLPGTCAAHPLPLLKARLDCHLLGANCSCGAVAPPPTPPPQHCQRPHRIYLCLHSTQTSVGFAFL